MTIDLAPQGGRAPDDGLGSERQDDGRAPKVVIIGAGPAGLTAAAQLVERDVCPVVLEADDTVGGISRTVERDGWRFDIGGHRFFTKVPRGRALLARHAAGRRVHGAPADEPHLLRRQVLRLPAEGVERADATSASVDVADVRAVVRAGRASSPPADTSTFEGWVTLALRAPALRDVLQDVHREGVGRAAPTSSPADWAAQRIKSLSLGSAIVQRADAQAQPERRSPR